MDVSKNFFKLRKIICQRFLLRIKHGFFKDFFLGPNDYFSIIKRGFSEIFVRDFCQGLYGNYSNIFFEV